MKIKILKPRTSLVILTLMSLVMIACADQSLENYKARAEAEQDGSNTSENENLAQRAAVLEKDLWSQFSFYRALESDFQGQFKRNSSDFVIEMTFAPSRYLVKTDRPRTLAEIEDDFANLHLKAMIKVYAANQNLSANGCVFENIKPDLENGVLTLIDEDCPLMARLRLKDPTLSGLDSTQASRILAQEIRQGLRDEVQQLDLFLSSKLTNITNQIELTRKK